MSKKTLRLLAIVFILIGVCFCIGLLAFQYFHCVDVFNTTHKGAEFASAYKYFLQVSKGAIAISISSAFIMISLGIYFFVRSRKTK